MEEMKCLVHYMNSKDKKVEETEILFHLEEVDNKP
jgi:hypothetical protein